MTLEKNISIGTLFSSFASLHLKHQRSKLHRKHRDQLNQFQTFHPVYWSFKAYGIHKCLQRGREVTSPAVTPPLIVLLCYRSRAHGCVVTLLLSVNDGSLGQGISSWL